MLFRSEASVFNSGNEYLISWVDTKGGDNVYTSSTKDFKHFTSHKSASSSERRNTRVQANIDGQIQTGTVHRVAWSVVDDLVNAHKLAAYKHKQNSERIIDDNSRYPGLKPLQASISFNSDKSKQISDMLMGIFFEDINYAADGGIYAELIQNRGFEYYPGEGKTKDWGHDKAWSIKGKNASFSIKKDNPLHDNNPHYALVDIKTQGASLVNSGFDGIPVKKGDKYDFSLFARNAGSKSKNIKVRITSPEGKVLGETTINGISNKWKQYKSVITVRETVNNASLEIMPLSVGELAVDMVSLFPQKTFKNRKNGMRADLAQTLADMHPRFVRFPGGCVAHGNGLDNMYKWQNTVGPLEARKPQRNLWGYHQSMGLGYYEYFQFCEDLGAAPLPVVPAGVPCQNSSIGGHGQQCGIPMDQMDEYIQEIFDLIEWANGDPKKNKWAKMRADAGHPKPFNLKYLGVGNEDLISEVFEERFKMISAAINAKYPEIEIVGTAGPFYEGSDYVEGWRVATEAGIPYIDEHYYNPPGWFINNQDFYDRYDRSKSKVYLGEYAAHVPNRHVNIETALAEALHLINVERNGDVVALTSYAPLLAKEKFTQWNPDLIYFNNTEVKPTVGYHVQKLFGQNAGETYIPNKISVSDKNPEIGKRIACSAVKDSKSGDIIIKVVNILPVETKVNFDLTSMGIDKDKFDVIHTVLKGTPDDRKALPVETIISPEELTELNLPAYSFTVLRLKN